MAFVLSTHGVVDLVVEGSPPLLELLVFVALIGRSSVLLALELPELNLVEAGF